MRSKRLALFTAVIAIVMVAIPATAFGHGQPEKRDAISRLQAQLPTGNSGYDKRIRQAIDDIQKSLNPLYWRDQYNLRRGVGSKVFDYEKQAVYQLKHFPVSYEEIWQVIDILYRVDRELAQNAIDDAVARNGDPAKIAEARKFMQNAAAIYTPGVWGGDPDKGVDEYKHAWQKADQA
jgi:hypothetical protein